MSGVQQACLVEFKHNEGWMGLPSYPEHLSLINSVLHISALVVGITLLYISIFLYEDEQGKIQNKLENLWVVIDDVHQRAISRHIAFMNVLARLLKSGTDRLFGPNLVSIQSIGVSVCYAFASLALVLTILEYYGGKKAGYSFLGTTVLCFVYGSFPLVTKNKLMIWAWFFILVLYTWNEFFAPWFLAMQIVWERNSSNLYLFPLMVLSGVSFGICLFFIFVVVIRKSLHLISSTRCLLVIVTVGFLNISLPITLYSIFKSIFLTPTIPASPNTGPVSWQMFWFFGAVCAIFTNLAFVFPVAIFATLSAMMVLHRAFWPLMSRPLYALQKLGIARRSKLAATIGALLIGASIGGWPWLEKIAEKINPF